MATKGREGKGEGVMGERLVNGYATTVRWG
jgi:hypothetical protein